MLQTLKKNFVQLQTDWFVEILYMLTYMLSLLAWSFASFSDYFILTQAIVRWMCNKANKYTKYSLSLHPDVIFILNTIFSKNCCNFRRYVLFESISLTNTSYVNEQ